jgi:rRNA maturation endonuclease Nob1
MLVAKGCTFTHVMYKGKEVKRSLEHWQEPGKRCHDCGAMYGQPHHYGCDVERCPICGNQMIGCDCFGDNIQLVGRAKAS